MKKILKIIHVVGARPNFVKIASILRACSEVPEIGTDTNRILEGYRESMDKMIPRSRPKFWDGRASQRTVSILLRTVMESRKLVDARAD